MKFFTPSVLNEGTPDNVCLVRCDADRNLRIIQVEPADTPETVSEWLNEVGLQYEQLKTYEIVGFYKRVEPKKPRTKDQAPTNQAGAATSESQQTPSADQVNAII
jgi:hypothetical protein